MNIVEAVKDVILQSGAGWVLWVLGLLSVASAAVGIERALALRRAGSDLRPLAERLHVLLRAGDYAAASAALEKEEAVAARIAAAGLRLADRGPAAADKAMQSAVALERTRLERRLAFLGTVGNNAPFVGLFGTVVGVVHAFEALGKGAPAPGGAAAGAAAAAAATAGAVASQAVMSAIAEALVATAIGILVALPAVAAFNWFQRRVATLLGEADALSNLVLAYLQDRTPAAEGS